MKKKIIVLVLALCVLGVGIAAYCYFQIKKNSDEGILYSNIYKSAAESVVNILTDKSTNIYFENKIGVMVSEDGTVATNLSNIINTGKVSVKLSDGRIFPVNGYKYISLSDNIALLKIDSNEKFKPAKLAKTSLEMKPMKVFAVSSPTVGPVQGIAAGKLSIINDKFAQHTTNGYASASALFNSKDEFVGFTTIYPYEFSNDWSGVALNYDFLDKINSPVVQNTQNFPWIKFVANSLDKKEFIEAIKHLSNTYYTNTFLYNTLFLMTYRDDFPKEAYPLFAYLANENRNDYDAIEFCRLAIENKINERGCYLLLMSKSLLTKNAKLFKHYEDYMQKHYPETLLEYYSTSGYGMCALDDNYCSLRAEVYFNKMLRKELYPKDIMSLFTGKSEKSKK